MAVLSQDIKERIVRSVMDDGLSQAETAQRLSVAESTESRTMRASPHGKRASARTAPGKCRSAI